MSNKPTSDHWNPAQYDRFRSERSQPLFDLLALVRPRDKMTVADLGCGTGELTQQTHRQLAAVRTLGIDSSAQMLVGSEALAGEGLSFSRQDIADFANEDAGGGGDGAERFDLI